MTSRFDRTRFKTSTARRQRQDSTTVERRLWYRIRNGQIDGDRFRRQHPAGPYVLDFYCSELRLAIELDGGQHNAGSQVARDQHRDAWFAERGIVVPRFWNCDVTENMIGVVEKISLIANELSQQEPSRNTRWLAKS